MNNRRVLLLMCYCTTFQVLVWPHYKGGGGSERNIHCSFLHKITFIYKVTWFITFVCEVFLFDAVLCFLHSLIVKSVIHKHFYHLYKVYSYFGQDSADIKIDNVTSSRIWSRNSALAQASSGDSILVGFN